MTISELLDKYEGDYKIIRSSVEKVGSMNMWVNKVVQSTLGSTQLSTFEELRWNDWDKDVDRFCIKKNVLVIEYEGGRKP